MVARSETGDEDDAPPRQQADLIRVLHVDDEPGFADLAADHLERVTDTIDVVTETSARDGLARLETDDIDCVVSDYAMPGMGGLEFLEAVRSDQPELPFILFTGRGSEAVASDAISAGVSDYMPKRRSTDQYTVLAKRIRNAVDERRASERRTEARERAATILENAPDAILVSVDHTHVYANPAALDVFDVDSRDEILDTRVFELIAADDRDTAKAQHDEIAASNSRITRANRTLTRPDGESFPAEVTVRSITWNGEPGLVAIIRDQSDTDEHEALRRRYATAFTEASDGIAIVNDAKKIVEINRSGIEILARPKPDLIDTQLTRIASTTGTIDDVWERLEAGESVSGRATITRPDGAERSIDLTATPDVQADEHVLIFRDVTERVEREEREAANQEAIESMYRIVSNTEISVGLKIERLLELGTDYLGVPYGFVTRIDGNTQEIVTAVGDHDALQAGESCPLGEAYCRETVARDELVTVQNALTDGWADDPAYERFGLGCYIGAKITVADELYGTLCFAGTDARPAAFSETERVFVELLARWLSYERTQQQMTAELTQQNERLEKLASVISHDLRSPLSVAEGYLDLARDDGDPDAFDRVKQAHDRMDRIIGDILYLAREDRQIASTALISLDDAVADAWAIVEAISEDATLTTTDELGSIDADDNRLQQLLENLFRNAIEHAGSAVAVRVDRLADGAGFAVEDDGPGIPPGEREDVFDWGHSGDGGSGIGLYTVKEVVEGHGWAIEITEGEMGGARFEIRTESESE